MRIVEAIARVLSGTQDTISQGMLTMLVEGTAYTGTWERSDHAATDAARRDEAQHALEAYAVAAELLYPLWNRNGTHGFARDMTDMAMHFEIRKRRIDEGKPYQVPVKLKPGDPIDIGDGFRRLTKIDRKEGLLTLTEPASPPRGDPR